jgi:hypothetical protein
MSVVPKAAVLGALVGACAGAVALLLVAWLLGPRHADSAAWAASVIGLAAAAGCWLGYRAYWRASAHAVTRAVRSGPPPRPGAGRAAGRGAVVGLGWGVLAAGTLVLVSAAVTSTATTGNVPGVVDPLLAMVPTFALVGAVAGGVAGLVRAVARD